MMDGKDYEKYTVYIPKDTFQRLGQDAAENRRNLSAQVVFILEQHYKMIDAGVSPKRAIYHTN